MTWFNETWVKDRCVLTRRRVLRCRPHRHPPSQRPRPRRPLHSSEHGSVNVRIMESCFQAYGIMFDQRHAYRNDLAQEWRNLGRAPQNKGLQGLSRAKVEVLPMNMGILNTDLKAAFP